MNGKLLYGCLAIVVLGLSFPARAESSTMREILLKSLGGALYSDQDLSLWKNQSCKSCHHPRAGFADPDNADNPKEMPVSDGSDTALFGGRNAPTASYAGFSPKLHWNAEDGLFIGGLFWDGRASGLSSTVTGGLGDGPTGDPLADQAKGPFLNPVEMALADELDVVEVVRSSSYAWLFQVVFPGVLYNDDKVGVAYDNIAESIAAFERSSAVNRFNSRFDGFVREQGGDVGSFGVEIDPSTGFRKYVGPPEGFKSVFFSHEEADGLALFNADSEVQAGIGTGENVGGACYRCHITERHDPKIYGRNATVDPNPLRDDGTYPPILTDFSYDNLGIPKSANPLIAGNPVDYGLGAAFRLSELDALNPAGDNEANERGKFKTPSLRNVAATAPYGHNGLFHDLKSIVHFYNVRDVESFPEPETPENVNTDELGNLGLSGEQEDRIILFLKTLTDG